jgi:hypothetical protein
MARQGWNAEALRRSAKREERKVRLAGRLRAQTTMSLQWIAEHLGMGSWPRVSNLVGATTKQDSLNSTSVQIGFLKRVERVSVFDENEGENCNPNPSSTETTYDSNRKPL